MFLVVLMYFCLQKYTLLYLNKMEKNTKGWKIVKMTAGGLSPI